MNMSLIDWANITLKKWIPFLFIYFIVILTLVKRFAQIGVSPIKEKAESYSK